MLNKENQEEKKEYMMQSALYDVSAPKRKVNMTANEDLVKRAKAAGINISKELEHALENALARHEREKWIRENKEALEETNDYVKRYGLPNQGMELV